MASKWGDEVVEKLKALAEEGLSASQAASHFNGMSRCAAVGLAYRKGFNFHSVPRGNSGSYGAGRPNGHGRPKTNGLSVQSRPKRAYLKCETIELEDIGTVTLSELDQDGCRFIYGDPLQDSHRYCGRPSVNGYSWCSFHCTQVFEQKVEHNGHDLNASGTQRDDRRADAPIRTRGAERAGLYSVVEVPEVG